MILQALAALNAIFVVFDAYVTESRIRKYTPQAEMQSQIRWLATHLGPKLGTILGVIGPGFGWTAGLFYFHLAIPLAFLTGYNAKRFMIRLLSFKLEHDPRVQALLQELGHQDATLPSVESTTQDAHSNSREGK
jgi:hypothetical protein